MKESFLAFLATFFMTFILAQSVSQAALINSGFETGDLFGWSHGGQTGVQSDVVFQGDYAAYVGTVDFNMDDKNDFTGEVATDSYKDNWISQVVDITGMDTLSLWYNFYTWDSGSMDSPAFVIEINGSTVLSLKAGDLDPSPFGDSVLDSTGWTLFSHDLSGYSSSTITLTIYAGNTLDNRFQSWAYIDNSSSTPIPEPASIALILVGLAGLIVKIKRI